MVGKQTKVSLFKSAKSRFRNIQESDLHNLSFDNNLFVKNSDLFEILEEFLNSESDRSIFLLTGGVGSGKTWNSIGFLDQSISKGTCLPFYISFKTNYNQSLGDIFNLPELSPESLMNSAYIEEISNIINDMSSSAGVPIFLIFDDFYNLPLYFRPAWLRFLTLLTNQCGPALKILLIDRIFDEILCDINYADKFNGVYFHYFKPQKDRIGEEEKEKEEEEEEEEEETEDFPEFNNNNEMFSRIIEDFKGKIYLKEMNIDFLRVSGLKFPISAYLDGFNESELKEAVKNYEIKEQQIPAEFLELLKIPKVLRSISERGILELPDNFINFTKYFYNPINADHSLLHILEIDNPIEYFYPVFSIFERCDRILNQKELMQYINSNKLIWIKLLSYGIIKFNEIDSDIIFRLDKTFLLIFSAFKEYFNEFERIFNDINTSAFKNSDILSIYKKEKQQEINTLISKAKTLEENSDYFNAIETYMKIIDIFLDLGENQEVISTYYDKIKSLQNKWNEYVKIKERETLVDFYHSQIPLYEYEVIKEFELYLSSKIMPRRKGSSDTDVCEISNNHIISLSIWKEHEFLPSNFGDLKHLESLSLYEAKYTSIPKCIFGLKNLKILRVRKGKIKEIPKEIENLKELNELNLASNQIHHISESIGKLTKLKKISLFGNKIEILPETIGKLKNLESLDLLSTKIQKLPESIGNLTNLKFFRIGYETLEVLPNSFCNLTSLESLTIISREHLTSLPDKFGNLKKLKVCKLNCCLNSLPKSFKNLTNLIELDLSDNSISDISNLSECKNLKILSLKKNKIKELPKFIGDFSNLEELDLESNEITEIPEEIANLKRLKILALMQNPIEILPLSITTMRNLEFISIDKSVKNYKEIKDVFKKSKAQLLKVKI